MAEVHSLEAFAACDPLSYEQQCVLPSQKGVWTACLPSSNHSLNFKMAASGDVAKDEEYSDFKCQFDTSYASSVVKGHKEWIENKLVTEIRSRFREADPYRILAVGSGTGYPDQGLMEVLSTIAKVDGLEGRKIVYTVSEPDPKAVAVCEENLKKASANLNVDFVYDVGTSEKYLLGLNADQDKKFDLIHFVHVISWLKNHEKILAKCHGDLLAKDGLIAIIDFNKEFFGEEGEHCEGEECKEGKQGGDHQSKSEKGSDDKGEEDSGGLMYVEVDLIAIKHGWSCVKFANDLKIDLSEAGKSTDAGRMVARAWSHTDASSITDDEKEKNRIELMKSLTKEEVDGETKYYYVLKEMIYFLTK